MREAVIVSTARTPIGALIARAFNDAGSDARRCVIANAFSGRPSIPARSTTSMAAMQQVAVRMRDTGALVPA